MPPSLARNDLGRNVWSVPSSSSYSQCRQTCVNEASEKHCSHNKFTLCRDAWPILFELVETSQIQRVIVVSHTCSPRTGDY